MNITYIQKACLSYIKDKDYKSFDLYDALTNSSLNKISKKKPLLRRIIIQIRSRSPIDLHWLGMKKMVHTKTISDLLWYNSIKNEEVDPESVKFYFEWLIKIKNKNGYGWGLNFPYTSRFVDADENTPNLYNTINSGIAICYSLKHLNSNDQQRAKEVIQGIVNFLDQELGFVDEGDKGWYLYYPGQKYPTYNVNALALYFLSFVPLIGVEVSQDLKTKIDKIICLLIDEQEIDGSWFYSRSPKGKWIDGFHSAFIIESIAFAYKNGYKSHRVKDCLDKGWDFYISQMFTSDGYPKYFLNSNKYPIEAQNVAQSIQTISVFGTWLGKEQTVLLKRNIEHMVKNLYDSRGFIYHKKERFWTFKSAYIRWSVTPMILALEYAKQYLKTNHI
jgi:hypothetical protein